MKPPEAINSPGFSDEERDAARYHDLLRALQGTTQHIRQMEESRPDVEAILAALLPDLAHALNAETAFAAVLREPAGSAPHFEITVSHPDPAFQGKQIAWCNKLAGVVRTGEPAEWNSPDPDMIELVGDLAPFPAHAAIAVQMETRDEMRIVAICDAHLGSGGFITHDKLALDKVIELVAIGIRAGERRAQELSNIQDALAAISTRLELSELLPMIAQKVADTFHAPAVSLMFWDKQQQYLEIKHPLGLPKDYVAQARIPRERIERLRQADGSYQAVVVDLVHDPLVLPELAQMTRLSQALSSPLLEEGRLIGALNVYSRDGERAFTPPERALAEIFARQAAIAVHNAQLFEDSQLQARHLRALHEASKALVEGFTLDRKTLLERIIRQAVDVITCVRGQPAEIGVVQLLDRPTGTLELECVYPRARWDDMLAGAPRKRQLGRLQAAGQPLGITGRAALTRKAQLVGDAKADPDYIGIFKSTRSELAVPLMDQDEVIGVLSVESMQADAFDAFDVKALEGLAAMAVIVIKHAGLQDQLRRNTTVALMGAWQACITHDAGRPIGAIRRNIGILLARKDLPTDVQAQLKQIDAWAGQLAMPEIPSGGPALGVPGNGVPCVLDQVVRHELDRLRKVHPNVTWEDAGLGCGQAEATMHRQWLLQLLGHLTRNALEALEKIDDRPRRASIRTWQDAGMAHVQVEDDGAGVDPKVKPLLFVAPIEHEDQRKGRGLLLVRCLAEMHGGDAKIAEKRSPGPGSCFEFWVPVVRRG